MDRGRVAFDGVSWLARRARLIALLGVAVFGPLAQASEPPARVLFGRVQAPSDTTPGVIGSYAKGCLSGAERLPDAGSGYQTMRPSRNRTWGHPILLRFLEDLAVSVAAEGHAPVLIGDMAQPRGGPMLTGHASHQSGLDVDIWFRSGPSSPLTPAEREAWTAHSVVKSIQAPWVTEEFTRREARLIELASRDARTARIFVAAPIKKALCEATPEGERDWLQKVRPWYGHKDHLHVRLGCPGDGGGACAAQEAPPSGDGCGEELAAWLTPPKAQPKPPLEKPGKKPEILLSQLPEACAMVLRADPRK